MRRRFQYLIHRFADLPLNVKGVVVVAIPVCALLAAVAIFYAFEQQSRDAQRSVEHTYEVRSGIRQILFLMVDAEADMRGHLLTAQESDHQGYLANHKAVPPQLANMARLVRDNAGQLKHLAVVENAIGQAFRSMDLMHEGSPGGPGMGEAQTVEAGAMNVLRRELTAMVDVENRLLAQRTAVAEAAQRRLGLAILLGGAIGLLGGILAALLFTTRISARMQRLEQDARLVAKGVAIQDEVSGTGEIARLERTLRQTSRLLAGQQAELRAAHEDLEARVHRRTAELMAANEELREANELRRAITDHSPLGIWAIDLDGKVTYWNPAAERIFGWPAAEVLGRRLPRFRRNSWRNLTRGWRGFAGESNWRRWRGGGSGKTEPSSTSASGQLRCATRPATSGAPSLSTAI